MPLSEVADRRLRAYCSRARCSRSDFVDNGHGREARYLAADLRAIVWRDVEVRTVLLSAGEDRNAWNELLLEFGQGRGLPLLDLVSATSLEARTSGVKV